LAGYWDLMLGIGSGLAQGVFEWIPVSSKTILLLLFYWAGYPASQAYLLGLFLNGATAAAAAIYLRRDLLEALRGVKHGGEGRKILVFLIVSTLATGILAIPFASLAVETLKEYENLSMLVIGFLYMIMSIMLWLKNRLKPGEGSKDLNPIRDGIFAGIAQGFSALPGISRSGTTILALLMLGYNPATALRLSFLMSIPATLGGALYVEALHRKAVAFIPPTIIFTSMTVALLTSIAAISILLKASEKLKPQLFTLILAVITILAALTLIA